MWPVVSEPFDVDRRDAKQSPPFWYWLDNEFPAMTYAYRVADEDPHNAGLSELDPGRLVLTEKLASCKPFNPSGMLVRLGGRALQTIWNNRDKIPERLWSPSEEVLPYTKAKASQFCIDGLRLFNPHNVLCIFYFVRFRGEVRWGITPIDYERGPLFQALVLQS